MSSDDEALLVRRPSRTRKSNLAQTVKPAANGRRQIKDESSDDDALIALPVKRRKIKRDVAAQPKQTAQPKKKATAKPARKSVKEEIEEDDVSKSKLNFKEGQKHLCPPMGDGTRAFYESLLKERPNSVMANKYCIEHGALIGTQHKEQWIRYQQLRDLGAFRGVLGGVRVQFKDGISEEDLYAWRAMRGVTAGGKKAASPRKA